MAAEWKENFRMSRANLENLAMELKPYLQKQDTVMRNAVDVFTQVCFLFFQTCNNLMSKTYFIVYFCTLVVH